MYRLRIPLLLLALCVAAIPAGAATHIVDQVGFTFVPETLDIQAGDTVEWHWQGGIHTVTEGASCTPSGFDFPLTEANPTVSVTFNTPGTVDYYCTPHCLAFNMVGVITVGAQVPATHRWGLVLLATGLVLLGGVTLRRRRAARHA